MTVPTIMYKAVDTLDNKMSLFAVRGDSMSVVVYMGEHQKWLSPQSGKDIKMNIHTNFNRMKYPIVMLWSSDKVSDHATTFTAGEDVVFKVNNCLDGDKDLYVSMSVSEVFTSMFLSAETTRDLRDHLTTVLEKPEPEPEPLKVVTMFKATDRTNGLQSCFAFSGDKMCVCRGDAGSGWEEPGSFGDFDSWTESPLDVSRMIKPQLLWSQ
jgi:hypothetical protein